MNAIHRTVLFVRRLWLLCKPATDVLDGRLLFEQFFTAFKPGLFVPQFQMILQTNHVHFFPKPGSSNQVVRQDDPSLSIPLDARRQRQPQLRPPAQFIAGRDSRCDLRVDHVLVESFGIEPGDPILQSDKERIAVHLGIDTSANFSGHQQAIFRIDCQFVLAIKKRSPQICSPELGELGNLPIGY